MTTTNSIATALLLAAALAVAGGAAQAQSRAMGCGLDGKLPQVQDGSDLTIKMGLHSDICEVDAGTYKFGNVNIIEGGTLKFNDAVIDFWAKSILVESTGSLIAGSDSAPIGTNGLLTIHLYGPAQSPGTGNGDGGVGIACMSGNHDGLCGVPPDIWNSNVIAGTHMPVPPAQARKIKDLPSGPNYLGFKDDYFYPYHPLMFDDGKAGDFPVGYFGYKVLGVSYGGTLQLFGKRGATYANPECGPAPSTSGTSWARLAMTVTPVTPTDPAPQTVKVDRKLTLEKGDKIVVTTTDYLPGHSEEMTVSDNVTCSETFNVDEKFKYIHNGERYPLTSVPTEVGLDPQLVAAGAETRAAVALLTRSIRIVSEGDTLIQSFPAEPPPGSTTPGYYFGGHVVVRQGFKTFQVKGVEFKQMGQGGRIGHYPVHFHHARRTPNVAPNDTFVRDSSIHDSMTRWIVLHGTQDVKLERNVGYKSIGHGFYLEDGTEINNTLTANLGIFARAAVDNVQNPRKVPGILAAPDLHTTTGESVPYRSDYDHPTVFWIMNGWNDFKDNMAVGAGTCGVCYWLLPGVVSGLSRGLQWESYASMQSNVDRGGMAPLKSFIGNSCTSAMTSFQTITKTEACLGVGPAEVPTPFPVLSPVKNSLAAKSPDGGAEAAAKYYPTLADGGHFPTRCGTGLPGDATDCSSTPVRCSAGSPAGCMVTVLDRYTTSFNWAAFNFAAIWLRPQWYLVTDSVITDAQQAGLTMVTGGGYSESDVIPGHWALVRKSVFIGSTQDQGASGNPFAYNGGPFNPQPSTRYPNGLRCATDGGGNRPGSYCLSAEEGVSHQVSNFGMYQRLFSVYDGPAFQDSNAYLNIKTRKIDDCNPFNDTITPAGRCDPPDLSSGKPRQSAWVAGFVTGLPKVRPDPNDATKDFCYMPNAAIGWKQPNGFYYPPAFHSKNLFFDNVDVRHFVISPLFKEGSLEPDPVRLRDDYCIWDPAIWTGFAGNDRQTVLNDDDGTLTGYSNTTVINLDDFFSAPVDAIQCKSSASSRTSPYEYVTTVVYPGCRLGDNPTCALAPPPAPEPPDKYLNFGDWNGSCTSERCYGIPLFRQDRMPIADQDPVTRQPIDKSIRMMGQATSQRSSLTVNHGTYYLDTTVDKETQIAACPAGAAKPCEINVFQANQTYYMFLVFAKDTTEQTYRFYVGENTNFDPSSIQMLQAEIGKNPVVFGTPLPLQAGRARWLNNDKASAKGVVEVALKVADLPGLADKIATAAKNKCRPATYCTWNDTANNGLGRCEGVTTGGQPSGDNSVCQWANADLDCPDGGCVGIRFTLPEGFATRPANDPRPNPRPPAVCLAKAAPWDVSLDALKVSDGVCPVETDKLPADFCQ